MGNKQQLTVTAESTRPITAAETETTTSNFLVKWVTYRHGWVATLMAAVFMTFFPYDDIALSFLGPLALLDEALLWVLVILWKPFKWLVLFFHR